MKVARGARAKQAARSLSALQFATGSGWIEKRAFLSGSSAIKMAVLTCSSVRSVHFVLWYVTEYYLIYTASNMIIWGLFAYYHQNKVHFVFSKSRSSQVNHMSSFPGHNGSWSKGTLWICGNREIAHCPQMAKIKFNKKNGTCTVIYVAYRVHRSMQPCHLERSIYAKCSCIFGGSCSFLEDFPSPDLAALFYFSISYRFPICGDHGIPSCYRWLELELQH